MESFIYDPVDESGAAHGRIRALEDAIRNALENCPTCHWYAANSHRRCAVCKALYAALQKGQSV